MKYNRDQKAIMNLLQSMAMTLGKRKAHQERGVGDVTGVVPTNMIVHGKTRRLTRDLEDVALVVVDFHEDLMHGDSDLSIRKLPGRKTSHPWRINLRSRDRLMRTLSIVARIAPRLTTAPEASKDEQEEARLVLYHFGAAVAAGRLRSAVSLDLQRRDRKLVMDNLRMSQTTLESYR